MDQEHPFQDFLNGKRELDRLLGLFFFGCNIPFVIVESVHFRNFINRLNPQYVIPTRKTLANSILDTCYTELQQSIANMEVRRGILLIDGWKNTASNTKNVVAMIKLGTGDHVRYIYLNSTNFSTLRETGDALQEVVNECIGLARDKYNIEIYAVKTDNAANMIRMATLVGIWHSTCNSHSGNLLCKSVVDNNFATTVNNLLKEFKHPALENQLVERGANRMVLVGETRWCTHRNAFRRCLRNLESMREIGQNQEIIRLSGASYNILYDPDFERRLQDNILILDPICELIMTCQKADCTLADATELWLRLDIPAVNEEYDRLVQVRRGRALNKYGLAANFLHPRYLGRRFAHQQERVGIVNEFFQDNLPEQGLQELQQFRNRDGVFGMLLMRNYESGITFWQITRVFYPILSDLALKLQMLCASTAQLERLFSEWSYVHGPKRNRLTVARSSKLIALYYHLRLNDGIVLAAIRNDNEENEEYEDE